MITINENKCRFTFLSPELLNGRNMKLVLEFEVGDPFEDSAMILNVGKEDGFNTANGSEMIQFTAEEAEQLHAFLSNYFPTKKPDNNEKGI